jgi:hypothetical protein
MAAAEEDADKLAACACVSSSSPLQKRSKSRNSVGHLRLTSSFSTRRSTSSSISPFTLAPRWRRDGDGAGADFGLGIANRQRLLATLALALWSYRAIATYVYHKPKDTSNARQSYENAACVPTFTFLHIL